MFSLKENGYFVQNNKEKRKGVAILALRVTLYPGSWHQNGVQGWSLLVPVRPRLDSDLTPIFASLKDSLESSALCLVFQTGFSV